MAGGGMGPWPDSPGQAAAVLGEDGYGIGAEQRVVADRRRNRPRTGAVGHKARLRVIGAVAAGFEDIDADDLVARQAGGKRRLRIGALEVEVARRALRHEAELLGGVLEKIRDDGNVWPFRRGVGGRTGGGPARRAARRGRGPGAET